MFFKFYLCVIYKACLSNSDFCRWSYLVLSLDLSFASRPNIHFSENFAAAGIISRFTSHLRGLFTKYEARLWKLEPKKSFDASPTWPTETTRIISRKSLLLKMNIHSRLHRPIKPNTMHKKRRNVIYRGLIVRLSLIFEFFFSFCAIWTVQHNIL